MYCDYNINTILDTGNKVTVYAYFCEGEYIEDVYTRSGIFKEVIIKYDKSPVSQNEIKADLSAELNKAKGSRTIIEEQA